MKKLTALLLGEHRLWLLLGAVVVSTAVGLGVLGSLPFFFKHHRIVSDGMAPTLTKGDIAVVRRRPYGAIGDVRRGDVVSWIKYARGSSYTMVWRVVGLPGDELRFVDTTVTLNGEPVEHAPLPSAEGLLFTERLDGRLYPVAYDREAERTPVDVLVRPGHLFLVGDNRDHAFDSRGSGSVPFSAIVGRLVWPSPTVRSAGGVAHDP